MARSRRVLPIGAVFGAIRAASRKWWCRAVVTGPWVRREWGPVRIHGSFWGPLNPSLRPSYG